MPYALLMCGTLDSILAYGAHVWYTRLDPGLHDPKPLPGMRDDLLVRVSHRAEVAVEVRVYETLL